MTKSSTRIVDRAAAVPQPTSQVSGSHMKDSIHSASGYPAHRPWGTPQAGPVMLRPIGRVIGDMGVGKFAGAAPWETAAPD